MDRIIVNNTMDAHRLLHLAASKGIQNEVKELLFRAYYTEGRDIGSPQVLLEIGTAAGLEETDVNELLASDLYSQEVRQDQEEAQKLGASGVPFFVLNSKYGVSGAQPTETFSQILQQVLEEEAPGREIKDGPACDPDGDCC
jgi:predicted DsbA family dithiol-disulfide isomerase